MNRWLLLSALLIGAPSALAQVDLVDPDVKQPPRAKAKPPPAASEDDTDDEEVPKKRSRPASKVELVDPDAKAPRAKAKSKGRVDLVDPDEPAKPKKRAGEPVEEDDDTPSILKRQPQDLKPGETPEIAPPPEEEDFKPQEPIAPVKKEPEVKTVEPAPKPKPPPPPILITHHGDADLYAAWERWRTANANFATDAKAEAAARAELLKLKTEVGARDIEPWAVAMQRAAAVHAAHGATPTAIDLAQSAVDLAPSLPSVQFGLARVYFNAEPTDFGRIADALQAAFVKLAAEPRYLRPMIADVVTTVALAIAMTAVLVVAVLLVRRLRCFLFDVKFFFPRAVPRWQSATMGLLFLSLPLVLRLGLVPTLLVAFFAASLYLTLTERLVAAALISCIGLLPLLGPLVVDQTAFADTPAEDVWQLEAGGVGAEAAAQAVAKRATEDKATFAELFALGSFELRRGKLDAAMPTLKTALFKQPNDVRVQTNLAVAMILSGDLENSMQLLESAGACSMELNCTRTSNKAELAATWFDLARLYQRRLPTLPDDQAIREQDNPNVLMAQVRARDAKLAARKEKTGDNLLANEYLEIVPLARGDLLALTASPEAQERVASQLTHLLLGGLDQPWAPFYPLAVCLLLVAFGALQLPLGAAKSCGKCGNPMSQRDDKYLSPGAALCTQCVNVFSKKGVVAPALKVRKQIEVARYTTRTDRMTVALGLVCSGLGHIFKGLPVRGTIYVFLFVSAGVAFFLRDGVLRAPFEGVPVGLKLAPLALLFLIVYGMSLRALFKKQGA
jgi:hypothetical protein